MPTRFKTTNFLDKHFLSEGFIYATSLKGRNKDSVEPERLFICIWPAKKHLSRISLKVKPNLKKQTSLEKLPLNLQVWATALEYELILYSSYPLFQSKKQRTVLRFIKTGKLPAKQATPLSYWGSSLKKGGHGFQIEDFDIGIFRANSKNKNEAFLQILTEIGIQSQKQELDLEDYLSQCFHLKDSYAVSIYMEVSFEKKYMKNGEIIYDFSQSPLPLPQFPISSILYQFYVSTQEIAQVRKEAPIRPVYQADTGNINRIDFCDEIEAALKKSVEQYYNKSKNQIVTQKSCQELLQSLINSLDTVKKAWREDE
ncbi:MAG: hypothetical protein AABZ60_05770 [Planctomycetota bacterium]